MTSCNESFNNNPRRERDHGSRLVGSCAEPTFALINSACSSAATPGADRAAELRELVWTHHGLVSSIATRYEGRGLPREDLIQVGLAGLALAAPNFEPAQGASFSTYGSWWIKNAIKNALLVAARPAPPELWC